jgi:hypothetical protein
MGKGKSACIDSGAAVMTSVTEGNSHQPVVGIRAVVALLHDPREVVD